MAVQTKERVFELIRQHQNHIRAFGIKKLGVFGSFVREAPSEDSDVDLLVEFEPEQETFDNFMHVNFFLEDLFQRRVEVITTEFLSPFIGPHILKEVEYVLYPA
jgi:predicted nucleotidyltransferase